MAVARDDSGSEPDFREVEQAAIAVRHSILIAVYHILCRQVPYQGLGTDCFMRHLPPERHARKLADQLARADYKVAL